MADSKPATRPLSPHLGIYRPMLTMMMSIFHRITGILLFVAIFFLVAWFAAAATSDQAFQLMQGFFGSWLGMLLLFGFTWVTIHHSLGGIRHLIWDTGKGFELDKVEALARANIIGSVVLTFLVWLVIFWVKA